MRAILKFTAFYTEYDRTTTVYSLEDGRYTVVVSCDGVDAPPPYERTFLAVSYAVDWAKDQL